MADDSQTPVRKSLKDLFVEVAQPDENGFSRPVPVEELEARFPGRFKLGNGGGWCRDDGALGKAYKIRRILDGGRIASVKLDGLNDSPMQRGINADIRKAVCAQRCAVLCTRHNVQVDHKAGTYDSHALLDTATQREDDFQPLSAAANAAKRQHCKRCIETGVRFDARQLGYSHAYTAGDASTRNCRGCYWYDPRAFNAAISGGYVKADEARPEDVNQRRADSAGALTAPRQLEIRYQDPPEEGEQC